MAVWSAETCRHAQNKVVLKTRIVVYWRKYCIWLYKIGRYEVHFISMFWKITAAFLIESHVERILTPYKETADFLNFKARGTDSNYYALKYLHYGSFFFQKYSLGFGLYWPPHGNHFRHTNSHTLFYLFQQLLRATHIHARARAHTHTRRKCTHTLSLSLSLRFSCP